jgi:DNA-directed RNA polymerase subunit beta
MPYLPNGTPIDMLLNPLGVPSRMNVGQLFECLLGFAADTLNIRFKVIPFDEMYGMEASRALINQKLKAAANFNSWIFSIHSPGKIMLSDGRTGKLFENPITVGLAYILKLIHLVDDKIHSRSTASYSLITQQPLGGRANRGGQRLGEMEVWALEAFGAAYTLEELLTLKSDDMLGRTDTLASIVKGCPIPRPGIPESFKVLMRELHALCLDIATYKVEVFNEKILNHHEIDILFEKKDN